MTGVWDRIATILPRLGDFDDEAVGEALNAIDDLLEEAHFSWHDIAERIRSQPASAPQKPARSSLNQTVTSGSDRRQASAWAQDKRDVMIIYPHRAKLPDDWAVEFIESLHDQVVGLGRPLTEKQRGKLNENMDKLGL